MWPGSLRSILNLVKAGFNMATVAKFVIEGEIEDFPRIDNLYRSLKREGARLLKNWTITVDAKYIEKQGDIEVP